MVSRSDTPPHDLDAEQSVLGACLSSRDALAEIAGRLQPEDFYKPAHEAIWRECLSLFAAGEAVDAITLADRLAARPPVYPPRNQNDPRTMLEWAGGKPYIIGLLEAFGTTSSAPRYAAIVIRHAQKRRLIDACEAGIAGAYDSDVSVDDAFTRAEAAIMSARARRARAEPRRIRQLITEYMDSDDITERDLLGISTGLPGIDGPTLGLQAGQLWIVAARPSMGKTALVGDFVVAASRARIPAQVFSLEMTERELTGRLLSSVSGVPGSKIRRWKLNHGEVRKVSVAFGEVAEWPLSITDEATVTPLDIRGAARRASVKPGLIVIDYLQLMAPTAKQERRDLDVGEITRSLKLLAKELDIPVVLASQLNRGPENRHDKRPHLGDLRESGAIEQDADVVLMLYRPIMYDRDAEPQEAWCIIAKNRNGPTADVKLTYRAELTSFRSRAPEPVVHQETLDAGARGE